MKDVLGGKDMEELLVLKAIVCSYFSDKKAESKKRKDINKKITFEEQED